MKYRISNSSFDTYIYDSYILSPYKTLYLEFIEQDFLNFIKENPSLSIAIVEQDLEVIPTLDLFSFQETFINIEAYSNYFDISNLDLALAQAITLIAKNTQLLKESIKDLLFSIDSLTNNVLYLTKILENDGYTVKIEGNIESESGLVEIDFVNKKIPTDFVFERNSRKYSISFNGYFVETIENNFCIEVDPSSSINLGLSVSPKVTNYVRYNRDLSNTESWTNIGARILRSPGLTK